MAQRARHKIIENESKHWKKEGISLAEFAEYLNPYITADGNLLPDPLDPLKLSAALSLRIRQACLDLGIHCESASKIADYAIGLASGPRSAAAGRSDLKSAQRPAREEKKKVKWSDRSGRDKELNPIAFLEKYWSDEMRARDFYQADLRAADWSLFEAIRIYCRRHTPKLDPKDYLPPPLIRRTERRKKELVDVFARNKREATSIGDRRRSGSQKPTPTVQRPLPVLAATKPRHLSDH
jgi:hypothetical protein